MRPPFHLAISWLVVLVATTLVDLAAAQSVLSRIGYNQLATELGVGLPTGASTNAALVEGETAAGGYIPDVVTSLSLVGKTLVLPAGPTPPVSTHATNSAARYFGSPVGATPVSSSPGVDNVTVLNADDWINDYVRNGGSTPVAQPWDVSSHSYILISDPPDDPYTPADATDDLMRLDYSIDQYDTTVVVGTSNASSTTLPLAWTPSYNAISVGKTTGIHAAGSTTFYGSGRSKVDIVAPEGTSSRATPRVASAAALLHDAAALLGTPAVVADAKHVQTIKATLMAGATKHETEFAGAWDRTTTRPIDERFGAGQLNIYHSYHIQQGGEHEGNLAPSGVPVNSLGWDYEASFDPSDDQYYQFLVPSGEIGDELSVVLSWNIDVDDNMPLNPSVFDPVTTLANFDLELTRDSDGALIDVSQSSVDNVEHIYAQNLAAGTYTLKVSGDSDEAYGLAWRLNTVLDPSAVPEPTGLVLFGGTAIWSGLRRRRRKLSH